MPFRGVGRGKSREVLAELSPALPRVAVYFPPDRARIRPEVWSLGIHVEDSQSSSALQEEKTPASKRWLLLLISIVFCFFLFVGADAGFTAFAKFRQHRLTGEGTCFQSDPVRHHSLQADCQCVRRWGRESYAFTTDRLGLRDQQPRNVPLTAAQPRVLLLGDSFTEGMSAWEDTYVGQIAAAFPQYEFLNGGVESYAPSNYYNMARQLLDRGVKFDEVIVFIDISDAQDEAAFYRDKNPMGAVDGPEQIVHNGGLYTSLREWVKEHLLITNSLFDRWERSSVDRGHYSLNVGHGQLFDLPRSAWTYRAVNETEPYEIGYAPLGLEAGIRKEESKMTQLYQMLQERGIPISVVVYPWPAQLAHDKVDSRQVQIWRDWCNGKCKRFISVFPEFFAVKDGCPRREPGCWYMKDFIFGDEHYSRAGNALVAQTVGKSLEANPPVKRN